MDDYLNDWNGYSDDATGMQIIDAFFKGQAWRGVCEWAEKDCDDSIALMENILLRINTLVFFQEKGDDVRTTREINELSELIKPYVDNF